MTAPRPATHPGHTYTASLQAQARLHHLVPGGAHTYARGSDQYPDGMSPIIARGRGARVVDVDGNEYVEYGMGLRSVTLGHAYPPVSEAVAQAANSGVSFTRPSVWELSAAEEFLCQVPGADMVKFAKNGSDATTAAVKLARAATGRPLVALCHSQPFFSTDDWFIGTTPMSAGTLEDQHARTVGFDYNDLASVRDVLATHSGQVACLLLEAGTAMAEPAPGFLEGLQELARQDGCVLIFDEIITGMRWAAGGAQSLYGTTPDLSSWGKALGNGFSVSALAGRRDLMELGGLRTDASRAFLLSTTHGAETTGLAAYLAVAETYRTEDVVGRMESQGTRLASAANAIAAEYGLDDHFLVRGRSSCLVFETRDASGAPSQAFRTLFLQELLDRGVLGQSFVISAAHTDDDLDLTLEAVRGALLVYGRAVEQGSTEGFLRGRPVAPALREFAAPRREPTAGLEPEAHEKKDRC